MDKVKCELCNKEYHPNGIKSHIWRTHGAGKDHDPNKGRVDRLVNCTYCDNKLNFRSIARHERVCVSNPKNIKHCLQCNDIITSKIALKFCNSSCAATYNNIHLDKKHGPSKSESKPKYTKIKWLTCSETGKLYLNRNSKGNIIKNSPYRTDPRRKSYNGDKTLWDYRQLTLFKFDVYDYPDRFELDLVNKYGWYSPSNKGNNLSGISKDHMLSVKYGFDNNIDPEIIAHPANCKLMEHNKNAAKCANCDITYDELLVRIENW